MASEILNVRLNSTGLTVPVMRSCQGRQHLDFYLLGSSFYRFNRNWSSFNSKKVSLWFFFLSPA